MTIAPAAAVPPAPTAPAGALALLVLSPQLRLTPSNSPWCARPTRRRDRSPQHVRRQSGLAAVPGAAGGGTGKEQPLQPPWPPVPFTPSLAFPKRRCTISTSTTMATPPAPPGGSPQPCGSSQRRQSSWPRSSAASLVPKPSRAPSRPPMPTIATWWNSVPARIPSCACRAGGGRPASPHGIPAAGRWRWPSSLSGFCPEGSMADSPSSRVIERRITRVSVRLGVLQKMVAP